MWTRVLQFLKEPTGAALAKGSLVVLVFKVIGALGGYVLLFSLAKAGGELSVGVYEVAFTVLVIGSTLGRWGLDTVLVREMSREAKSGSISRSLYIAVFSRVTAITSLVALALFFGASFLTNLFFEDTPKEILATAAIAILPFTLMLLNAEVFRAIGKTILFSINQHGTIYIVIAALLWWIPLPEAMAFADTAQFALILLLGLSALFFIVSTIYILSLSATEVLINQPWKGQLFKIATPMLISSSLFLVISWSDTLMLGYFLPEERVGLYPRDSDFTKTVLRQLSEYFDGKRNKFDLPLAAQGTAFQKRVWAALMEIPSGTTASYADIAQKVESPKAVRAVGAANGQNPIGIIVPCHRIIGSNGKLTGYAFGLEKKAWLLQHEGAILL